MGVEKRTARPAYKSLQYFLNRSAVLAQYAQFMRITAPLAADVRGDVRRQIRAGFDAYRGEEDDQRVSLLLRQARDQLKMVGDLVDTAVARQRIEQEAQAGKDWKKGDWSSLPPSKAAAPAAAPSYTPPASTEGTWMDAPREGGDGTEDVKGRVGTGWPWKSSKPVKKIDLEGIKRR